MKGGANMKKAFLFFLTLAFTAMIGSHAAADDPMDQIRVWAQTVQQAQNQTGFLTRWNEEDQIRFRRMMEDEWGFDTCSETWQFAEDGLTFVFTQIYGDAFGWSPEQYNAWDTIRVQWGLTNDVLYVLPGPEQLTREQAIEEAKRALAAPATAELRHYDADTIIFADYRVRATFCQYDEGTVWRVDFHEEGKPLPTFEVWEWSAGYTLVYYKDFDTISMIYQDWMRERDHQRFSYWSLKDQAAFYNDVVLPRWQRELNKYGRLPEVAAYALAHQRSIPTENEISEAEAVRIALSALPEEYQADEGFTKLFFYRDDGVTGTYEVDYFLGDTARYAIRIDAETGTILSADAI